MRISLIAFGTRGDVQPMVALGQGLQARGHAVRLAASRSFKDLVESCGLDFFPLSIDLYDEFHTEAGYELMENGTNLLRCWRTLANIHLPRAYDLQCDFWNACQGAEAVSFPGVLFYVGHVMSEYLKIPSFSVYQSPMNPLGVTSSFPVSVFPSLAFLPGVVRQGYHVLTYKIYRLALWQIMRGEIKRWRQLKRLPDEQRWGPFERLQERGELCLYGHSPSILPKPDEWPSWMHVTGALNLNERQWRAPDRLIDFLGAGPAPLCVSFGSTTVRDPERITEIVMRALKRSGVRGIFVSAWTGLGCGAHSDHIFKLDSASYPWLFPRTAGLIHHGGMGTLTASLLAGKPCLSVPFFLDQPFWAYQGYRLGASPQPIPYPDLSEDRLVHAISHLTRDPAMHQRAQALGWSIAQETGVSTGSELVERYLQSF